MFEGIWWAFDDFWHLAKPFVGVRTLRLMVPLEAPEWTLTSSISSQNGRAERYFWLPCSCFGATFLEDDVGKVFPADGERMIHLIGFKVNLTELYIYIRIQKLSWIGIHNPIHLIYINHTHSMVPNSFIPYIHDAYGGCLIFTGEGILKHFWLHWVWPWLHQRSKDEVLCSSNPPYIFGRAPGYRTGCHRPSSGTDQFLSILWLNLFRRKPFALLGRKKEKSVAKEQNEIWWDM